MSATQSRRLRSAGLAPPRAKKKVVRSRKQRLAIPVPSTASDPVQLVWSNTETDLTVHRGDKIALIGANGAGKSTFLKHLSRGIIDEEECPLPRGRITRMTPRSVIAYLDQDALWGEALPSYSALELMGALCQDETRSRALLSDAGIDSSSHKIPLSRLSGGERVRLFFAGLNARPAHLLLLDEPTNHLDIDGVDALCRSLGEGEEVTAIIATHNRHLVREACNRIWLIEDGAAREYGGTIDDYQDEMYAKMDPMRG